jgi:hypothetical protein
MKLLRAMLGLVALLGPLAAQAAAGQVLFALGRVEIQRGGQAFVAQRGTTVEVGDTLTTGPTGLTQVRLRDGALLSLRYGSAMVVQEFRMPETPAAGAAPAVAAGPTATSAAGRSVLRLLRGAFRTVTGLIGKGANDAYSVVTPVATIGIRGTDYSAAYCSGDCGTTPDGLYVGVSHGEIELTNDGGALVLANDQYGYVKDTSTPPDETLAPPEVLETPIEPSGEDEESEETREADTAAAEEGGSPDGGFTEETRTDTSDADGGSTQPEGDYELRPGRAGSYAFAHQTLNESSDNGVYTDDSGALNGFLSDQFVSIGTASNVNQGADASFGTGLRWGRWTGGTASVGGSPLDLSAQSLHWIYAASPAAVVLRTTGSANYALIGYTNPTDSAGNAGQLGAAALQADFDNQTVSSSLNIIINNQVWLATGEGSIASGSPLFSGAYDSTANCPSCGVTINDAGGTPVDTGIGAFSGFFTSGAAGAGLSFHLDSSTTTVSGVAAFVVQGGAP